MKRSVIDRILAIDEAGVVGDGMVRREGNDG